MAWRPPLLQVERRRFFGRGLAGRSLPHEAKFAELGLCHAGTAQFETGPGPVSAHVTREMAASRCELCLREEMTAGHAVRTAVALRHLAAEDSKVRHLS